jgi:hypothetical protein
MANREVPAKRRIWLPLENALKFHHDQETCKSAGKFKSIEGLYLVSC